MAKSNQQKMADLAAKIAKQVETGAGRGLNAARVFLTARVKEEISVPAPRAAVRASPLPGQKKGGILYYRAVTPATVGAPPRKLSSRMRTSTGSEMVDATTAVLGVKARANPSRKYPDGFNYPRHHEQKQPGHPSSGQHQFIKPTVAKYKGELKKIIGRNVRVG